MCTTPTTRADTCSTWVTARGEAPKRNPFWVISTVAGNGAAASTGDGVPATQAAVNQPIGVAVGPDGAFYVSEFAGNRVRRVGPDGIITTVAGIGAATGHGY